MIFERAASALAAGNYSAAEKGFRAVLQLEPTNVGALGNLGVLYAQTDRPAQAIVEYRKALSLSPNDQAILLNLGIAYFKEDRHAAALPYLDRVTKLNPQNRQARQLSAVCRLYLGQAKQALAELESLRTSDPHDEQLLFLLGFAYLKDGNSDAAKNVFHDMFQEAGPARAQFLFGRACYEAALFPQAEESFLQVQKLDPNFPGLALALGKLYISQRRTDDAIRELRTALSKNSDDEEANYFLGSLLVREGREREGIPYLETARRLKPDSWAVYFYLGRAELRIGQKPEALKLLKKSVDLNPDDANAQYQLARALQSSGQTAAAEKAFSRARAIKAGELDEAAIPGVR